MRAALVALVLVAGCYRTRYVELGPPGSAAGVAPVHAQSWQSFFVVGLAPSEHVLNVPAACGANGAAALETQGDALGLGIGVVSYGIYVPYTARVRCADLEPAAAP